MLALRRAAALRRAPLLQLHRRGRALSTAPSIPTTPTPIKATTTTTNKTTPAVDFGDTAVAYRSLATSDLVRAYLVFRACGLRALVTHADSLLRAAYTVLGTSLTEALVKATFFRHFCAGETAQGIRPRVEALRRAGVGGILDYAAEADVAAMASPAQAETTAAYTEGAIQCRVYDYESERQCDAHVGTFLECIDAVKDVTPEGFAAIKVRVRVRVQARAMLGVGPIGG